MVTLNLPPGLLISLAKKYGTPLYVYNGNLILQKYQELYRFIKWPKLKIFYAMKANYALAILKLLNQQQAFIDAVSPGDVLLALKAGFTPERILFTANNITDQEMHLVKKLNVLFNLDSLSRLEKYGQAYPGTKLCLRFNSGVKAGENEKVRTGGESTKFGILLEQVPEAIALAKKYHLTVIGLHEHTGSGIPETVDILAGMSSLLKIINKKDFPHLEFVDFGGGFKVPYAPQEKRIDYQAFGQEITQIFADFCRSYGQELELCFEPGKYIVSESGFLIVEVNTLKHNPGKLIAGTNSGFPQLIRPMFYNAYHHIINLTNPQGEIKAYDICGNICESGDCFAANREIPEIKEGDLLAILNAGAYCYSMGGVYNLRPMPAEVLVLNNQDRLIRKRLSCPELIEQIAKESL